MHHTKPRARGVATTALEQRLTQAFELDPRAARLFTVLLDLGRTTVQRLAVAAKTERTGTYDVLNRLLARGLVETQVVGSRTLYAVVNPDKIRVQSAAALERIDALMPNLRARYAKHTSAPQVQSLMGEPGFQALMERIATAGPT